MPADRWNAIRQAAIDDAARLAEIKQAGGEPLTAEDRQALLDAAKIIEGEIYRWERGEPLFPDEAVPAGTPQPVPTGTPVPGTPEMPVGPPPAGNLPPDIGPPSAAAPAVLEQPTDRITVFDPAYGTTTVMSRAEYDRLPSFEKGLLQVLNAEGAPAELDTGAARPTQVEPPPAPPPGEPPPPGLPDVSANVANPQAGEPPARGNIPSLQRPAPATPPAAAPRTPPATPPRANPERPPTIPPGRPGAPPGRAPAPPRATPSPPPAVAPPAPAPPPPPPFAQDPEGVRLPAGRLTRAIERAGGRPTQRVTERVAGEIGEVFRPGEQGGYRGDTGGWRTLAHQAAAAWEQQYREAPDTLKASERAAYERNPQSLYQTILQADSPYRDYRESWIGAARAGQLVPGAAEFTGEVGAYPQYGQAGGPPPGRFARAEPGASEVTDAAGVPRALTPGAATRAGAPLTPPPATAAPEPGQPTPDLAVFGAVPESELNLRPGDGIDLSGFGAVPESELRTPGSATQEGAPLTVGPTPEATAVIVAPEVPDIGPLEMVPETPLVEGPLSALPPRREGRADPTLLAVMQSDANQPWPQPPPRRSNDPYYAEDVQQIIDQGKAEGRSDWEIAESLEMNGFGDAEEWLNAFIEEDMRFQREQLNRYPPDGGGYLSPIPPPGEAPFYGPDIQIGAPWMQPPGPDAEGKDFYYDEEGNQVWYEDADVNDAPLPPNYDEWGNPVFQAEPSYYEEPVYAQYEEPTYYEEPVYDEVAYAEPSYDYEEYVEEVYA